MNPDARTEASESSGADSRPASRLANWGATLRAYFVEQDPTFLTAFVPALVLAALIFVRSPLSNYIFDEQEALLANPYVNGQGGSFLHAFKRDFWGLTPDRSIGSYRPLPNLVWRALWVLSDRPFLHHWVNVVAHAANAALVAGLALAISKRRDLAWLAGASFLVCAVLTEAVTGVVGIADVLSGLFVLLAIAALGLSLALMPLLVFLAVLAGFFSKESSLVALPLVPWVALVAAPLQHPQRPLRVLRAFFALLASASALVAYTYFRRHFFPVVTPVGSASALVDGPHLLGRSLHAFLQWFRQPELPHDPINNPLVNAATGPRVAGALRVYARGLGQVVFPWSLSGDYSFPAEPIPTRLYTWESVVGGVCLVLPVLLGVLAWLGALVLERLPRSRHRHSEWDRARLRPGTVLALLAIGLVWLPVAYFPHSNILVLLPTVRAERFWYLPAIGSSVLFGLLFAWLCGSLRTLGIGVVLGFLGVQTLQARMHAFDYTDDLIFWRAASRAVPRSAKARLNYSVMLGARGKLNERLAVNAEALRLAPSWPMARIYYADTLCRLHRPDQAWSSYAQGFEMAPNDLNLIALGLQCLWEEKAALTHKDELLDLAEKHPGSWLAYLATDLVNNGASHGGVQKKYRPRAYDEGPKRD